MTQLTAVDGPPIPEASAETGATLGTPWELTGYFLVLGTIDFRTASGRSPAP